MVSLYTDDCHLDNIKLRIPCRTHVYHLWDQETSDIKKILADRAAKT